ncbi:glycosyltransferase [Mucilaginibacter aquaedulcis]|uniref:glycosyltransferase n=1 Tax=Mucilaginibacter aquaedulcis TaxID=1187081 RepID=UPI0025B2AA9B|nr:glycosyltransferase [Mucilaginibacter aquaedulcis]MDN3548743.1 glycosyltransferase [Mucilaginibacter aquaedulcis]
MSKKLLIISPYFPPVNAADMQRVRMSLPYFAENGWDVEVVAVAPQYTDINQDELLLQTVPDSVIVHHVKALRKQFTSKLGLGSIALRSFWYYKQKVNHLLKTRHYDLIYFSTTQFPVCVLGAYWKKRFGIPYVIDLQDPWHSDYYLHKNKKDRPPKYWFSYRLNKYLEPIALKNADGLISVSQAYIVQIQTRYPEITSIPTAVITFGGFAADMGVALSNRGLFKPLLPEHTINIVYIGRGGKDFHLAISPFFEAFSAAIKNHPKQYADFRFHFIGTSYATSGQGRPTIMPLARQFGLESFVIEQTDRISYYHTLITLLKANALFIPGSDDPAYTGSKIYPYLLCRKPLLAILHKESSAGQILKACGAAHVYNYEHISLREVHLFFEELRCGTLKNPDYNAAVIHQYSAEVMTNVQSNLFDQVIQ